MEHEIIALAERLGHRLKERGFKIATAESCTGGGIAQAITEIPGSSEWFDRSFVTYSNAAKIQMLGVKPETLVHYGAVSAETAKEMVEGALLRSEADGAVAVTGIAGPGGGTESKPVGTVFIAWQWRGQTARISKFLFSGDRRQIRQATVKAALDGIISRA
ncbi:MAG: CinA family protein [Gammaproteobacteria bacterium]